MDTGKRGQQAMWRCNVKLGIDAGSLGRQPWDAFEHLAYARGLGVDVVHFSEPRFFASLEDGYLGRVRDRAQEFGLELEAGMGVICPTSAAFRGERGPAVDQLRQMLRVAHLLGSRVLRVVAFSVRDRRGELPFSAHIEAAIETCRAVRDLALELGVKIAIENHAGDLQGRELKALIEEIGPEYVGACIDTGNAFRAAESPFVTLEHLAPYVAASHIRDTAAWEHPRGTAVQWVAMGDGILDLEEWSRLFAERCPGVPYTLEIITGGAPNVVNCLETAFWEIYPDAPAAEFVRFWQLVKQGQPSLRPMLTVDWRAEVPPEVQSALVVQQRLDLERSVRYCRDVLGIGEKAN
jgi:sugar phosphate isomerase/epimerase